jgi:hypothetical protein
MGKSVTLIEKQSRLGGHVNTYLDPVTGTSFDYGVISFDNTSIVTDYFAHFDIPLGPAYSNLSTITEYVNFQTGGYIPASSISSGDIESALLAYLDELAKYPYLSNGFDLPSQIPEDFLITWGDFLVKHWLDDLSLTAFQNLQGVGNILAQPALYMMKYLDENTVRNILTGEFVTTANHDNQELYNKALAELGSSAFISSNVTAVNRSTNGIQVNVSTPSGLSSSKPPNSSSPSSPNSKISAFSTYVWKNRLFSHNSTIPITGILWSTILGSRTISFSKTLIWLLHITSLPCLEPMGSSPLPSTACLPFTTVVPVSCPTRKCRRISSPRL